MWQTISNVDIVCILFLTDLTTLVDIVIIIDEQCHHMIIVVILNN